MMAFSVRNLMWWVHNMFVQFPPVNFDPVSWDVSKLWGPPQHTDTHTYLSIVNNYSIDKSNFPSRHIIMYQVVIWRDFLGSVQPREVSLCGSGPFHSVQLPGERGEAAKAIQCSLLWYNVSASWLLLRRTACFICTVCLQLRCNDAVLERWSQWPSNIQVFGSAASYTPGGSSWLLDREQSEHTEGQPVGWLRQQISSTLLAMCIVLHVQSKRQCCVLWSYNKMLLCVSYDLCILELST